MGKYSVRTPSAGHCGKGKAPTGALSGLCRVVSSATAGVVVTGSVGLDALCGEGERFLRKGLSHLGRVASSATAGVAVRGMSGLVVKSFGGRGCDFGLTSSVCLAVGARCS